MRSFQEIILTLKQYWAQRGCVIQEPYDTEVGAGTMCPETFLRVLGPDPYRVAYVQPSRRPADGRYGDNPNRLYKHAQLQVILAVENNQLGHVGPCRFRTIIASGQGYTTSMNAEEWRDVDPDLFEKTIRPRGRPARHW